MPSKNQVSQKINDNLPDNASPRIRSEKHREVCNIITDYATNIIKMISVTGATITNNAMAGRDVGAIVIDDYVKNTGFTKNLADNFLTFTDGTQLISGQSITIMLA
ncbi:MAG TPA: hypothetical protein VFQ86_03255 [Arachidicoccus soli]|nr:hypothetical protein [Arachidicoccus soli]